MCDRVTFVNPIPPAAIDVGFNVKDEIGGGGGSVPPGFNVRICGFEISSTL
jgi:hypothetical protein